MRDFKGLLVWQKGHELALASYKATRQFPNDELYGLTSQIRRAGASIPANIAEDCGRNGSIDFTRFLQIAFGSASELEYHLMLAHDLKYLGTEQHKTVVKQVSEVKRMLNSLIQKLRADG